MENKKITKHPLPTKTQHIIVVDVERISKVVWNKNIFSIEKYPYKKTGHFRYCTYE